MLQMPLSRILQVYIFQLGMGIFFLFMAILILRRDRKRINLYLSSFFVFLFIGALLNVIYAPITIIPIALILAYMCLYVLYLAPVFLLLFNLIIYKSEKIFNNTKQLIIFGLYAVVLIGWISIQGITIEKSNNYVPYWSLPFFLYMVISLTGMMIPTIYTSIKIYKEFEDKKLKKKWAFYIIGMITYFFNCLAVGFCNYYNDPALRLIYNTFALSLFIFAYLIYYGVGRQIEKAE